jgi:hypothetical protein
MWITRRTSVLLGIVSVYVDVIASPESEIKSHSPVLAVRRAATGLLAGGARKCPSRTS